MASSLGTAAPRGASGLFSRSGGVEWEEEEDDDDEEEEDEQEEQEDDEEEEEEEVVVEITGTTHPGGVHSCAPCERGRTHSVAALIIVEGIPL